MTSTRSDGILLTGGTGFLGGAVAAELLSGPHWPRTLLLVRAPSQAEGASRLSANLRRFGVDDTLLARIAPDQILRGDLSDADAFAGDARLPAIARVLNCAAVTSFGSHPLIWRTNVDGTLTFARAMYRLPNLRRFLQVGTAMICGGSPPTLVREDDYPKAGVSHLVEYTASKAEAEARLRAECPGESLVVARPSIIVGHSTLGCQPSHSIYWAFRMSDAMQRLLNDPNDCIDVVPVDFTARSLLLLLLKPELAHRTYHVSAGVGRSTSFREISAAFGRALGDGRATDRYQVVTFQDLVDAQDHFHAWFGRCNRRLMLRAMRIYGTFAGLGAVFDNQRLLDEGADPPPRFTDYLHRCVETSRGSTVPEQMLVDFM